MAHDRLSIAGENFNQDFYAASVARRPSVGARTRGEKGAMVGRGPSHGLRDAGPLAASFRRKMHIGYFYGGGRKGVRERLTVFRSISLEESTRTSFL